MPQCRNARVPSMKPGNGGWVSRLAVKQDGVLSRLLLSTLILFLNADPSKGNQYYRFPYTDLALMVVVIASCCVPLGKGKVLHQISKDLGSLRCE